jgi:hypothetical protein
MFFFGLLWIRDLKVSRCLVRTLRIEDVEELGVGNIWTQKTESKKKSRYNNCVMKNIMICTFCQMSFGLSNEK